LGLFWVSVLGEELQSDEVLEGVEVGDCEELSKDIWLDKNDLDVFFLILLSKRACFVVNFNSRQISKNLSSPSMT